MSWDKEVAELKRRQAFAAEMGGPEGIARQRQRGKLTVRERIDGLADPHSFHEFMGLSGQGVYT
ncbi:MAG: methylcrotonoyl-CoA carboxylase, partial [Pseudomonadales bacterium]